jgi:integrating conjugative element membrane protein (TIGR03745 family)
MHFNPMERPMNEPNLPWLRRWLHSAALTPAALLCAPALAALPTPTPPSTAPAAGDWLGLIKGYLKDGGLVMGLAVAVAAFVWAAWAAIAKFNEARNGRAEWGEVGLLAVVAGGILIFDSYLLGTAAGII